MSSLNRNYNLVRACDSEWRRTEDEDMKRIGRVMQEADRYLLIGYDSLILVLRVLGSNLHALVRS